jgi:predicted nucleotide-binding protein (sugar kinase/HSP70/actin superfamily)
VTGLSRDRLRAAWRTAVKSQDGYRQALQDEGARILSELERTGGRGIVLLGRAYNTLDPDLNLSIPRKMARLGFTIIPADMLPVRPDAFTGIFSNMYWTTGQTILSAAKTVAGNPRLHAVYFSNFKCGPDSFILSSVEQIMADKPMLSLELDEHGADAGYMTRIEAFLDVLRGNCDRQTAVAPVPQYAAAEEVRARKVWIPPMHTVSARLFAAAFRGDGWPAEALPPEDVEAHQLVRSLVRGAECLPTSLTIGAFVKKMREPGMNPAEHLLFMPTAVGPCRFGQYASLHRMILDRIGMKDTPVLSPSSYNTYLGLDGDLRRRLWHAIIIGDSLFKAGCRLRPYEREKGAVDAVIAAALERFEAAFETRADPMPAFHETIAALKAIPVHRVRKPLVGVVGEIYIRSNTFANQNVIGAIEAFGGEAWLAPLSEWIHYTAHMEHHNYKSGKWAFSLFKWGKSALATRLMMRDEDAYLDVATPVNGDRREPPVEASIMEGNKYVPLEFEGEAILTTGRAVGFMRDGAALVVNCSPFGCMPGTITTGIFQRITHELGVPVINMFYDGEGDLNRQIGTALANVRKAPVHPLSEIAAQGPAAPTQVPSF